LFKLYLWKVQYLALKMHQGRKYSRSLKIHVYKSPVLVTQNSPLNLDKT